MNIFSCNSCDTGVEASKSLQSFSPSWIGSCKIKQACTLEVIEINHSQTVVSLGKIQEMQPCCKKYVSGSWPESLHLLTIFSFMLQVKDVNSYFPTLAACLTLVSMTLSQWSCNPLELRAKLKPFVGSLRRDV